ncbi:MAG TPA: patatin-like phospholipase family protein [Gemmatimonadaceae bacterium]|jgi:NTE family protein|nr:patatin-like phospholipase family protein [Gemmatimonadaceae bacterium]
MTPTTPSRLKRAAPAKQKRRPRKIALVLGGGGLKGFAHIGVIRALEELKIDPTVVAGTSIGALIAAAYGNGMPVSEMEDRARNLKRRDLFRLNRMGMLLERTKSPSIYLEDPLRKVVEGVVQQPDFQKLKKRVLVNTVDIQRGSQVVWGLHGLRDVSVIDAVYASCALPGFYPPGYVGGRLCVDGGVIDNLPASIAGRGMDLVIAVDTGSSDLEPENDIATAGFTSIYMRAATTMMHALQLVPFQKWTKPPMILIRPKVSHIGWFSFSDTDEVLKAGYAAAIEALQHFEECCEEGAGVFPRQPTEIVVDPEKCIGCELCVALAPDLMAMDGRRKAYPMTPIVNWSPADGDFVHHCPTYAIEATRLERGERKGGRTTVDPTSEPTTRKTG